jgi:hypothetical protein
MERKPGEILFLVAVLAVVAGLCFSFIPSGLSSSEEAVQYVQMKNFDLNGSCEIRPPAFSLGFEARDLAGRGGFFEARDGRLYATTPPLFPWVASLFFPLFGERTIDVTPILFVFLSALVVGLILDRVMHRDLLYWLLLAVFLAGSPVFMQGLLFSGMALALFLITSALWLLVVHFSGNPSAARIFGASVLLGISILARPECLPTALSFWFGAALVLAVQRRMKDLWMILAGCAVGLALFFLHDVVLHGRFPGPYLQHLLPFHAWSPVRLAILGGALSLSLGLIVLSREAENSSAVRRAVLLTLSVILAVGAVLLTAARFSVSLLMALFPAVLFVFYGVPGRLERLKKGEGILETLLAAAVVVSLVLGAAILRPNKQIVLSVWLPMIPLVIVLIALERRTFFAAPGMTAVLAFFCGVAFVNGVQETREQILKYRNYNAARIAFLEKHTSAGDAIVFHDIKNMEHAGPLFFDRVFLAARNPADQARLVRQLRERSIDGIYAWTVNPLGIVGFNPFVDEGTPTFPLPPGAKACGSCKERIYHLVRLETGTISSAGAGRGGSL